MITARSTVIRRRLIENLVWYVRAWLETSDEQRRGGKCSCLQHLSKKSAHPVVSGCSSERSPPRSQIPPGVMEGFNSRSLGRRAASNPKKAPRAPGLPPTKPIQATSSTRPHRYLIISLSSSDCFNVQSTTSIWATLMAARSKISQLSLSAPSKPYACLRCQWNARRKASTAAVETDLSEDVVPDSSLGTSQPDQDFIRSWDPVQRSRSRRRQLPPSRYS